MPTLDVIFGFKEGTFGSYIHFPINDSKILITVSMVLEGHEKGMQIWKKGNKNRDLFPLFQNKRRSADTLSSYLHNFSLELFGDPYATLQLLNVYYKAMTKQKVNETFTLKQIILSIEPPILNGGSYNNLLKTIDSTFSNAIKRTYTQFCSLGDRLITNEEQNNLVELYKSSMPNHYHTMMTMMGMKNKEGMKKNSILVQTGFYDRRLFYMFLSQTRIKNPHNCV
mmetsp:Transcript_10163/g.14366  ORF Transcript_10163/g.14366 Transcript_10163/m.14366 type:complete len:225 (+) Transcript_10163:585-1259(+)